MVWFGIVLVSYMSYVALIWQFMAVTCDFFPGYQSGGKRLTGWQKWGRENRAVSNPKLESDRNDLESLHWQV